MSLPPEVSVSRGVVSSHLKRGLLPPEDRAVFRVLGTKELDGNTSEQKFRLAVTDGEAKFTAALIVLDSQDEGGIFLPEKDDVVDFRSGEGCRDPNRMVEKQGRHIWIVNNFRILKGSFAACDDLLPSTPTGISSAPSASRLPRTPTKRCAEEDVASSSAAAAATPSTSSTLPLSRSASTPSGPTPSSVKRSLFDGSRAADDDASASSSSSFSSSSPFSTSARDQVPPSHATHQIKDLNPYQNKYTIRGRCVHKEELKEVSSSRWQGHVFSLVLQDASGDIKATGFDEQAKKFHPIFREGKVFYVSHAQVKAIQNRRFNQTSHNYELGLNQNTVVVECKASSSDVPNVHYEFVKLNELDNKPENDLVDVIGVCSAVEDVKEVTARRSGRQVKKRDITLSDDSGADIVLTLWGEKAERFAGLNQVVAARKATVSDWNGKSLSLSFGGSIEENPELPESRRLQSWFEGLDPAQLRERTLSRERSFDRSSLDSRPVSLGEMKLDFAAASAAGQTKYCCVEAYVSALSSPDSIAYKACERCNKKLQESSSGRAPFHCPKCGEDRDDFSHRYLLRVLLADATDHQWASAFDEAATELLGGVPAADLVPLIERDPPAYQRALQTLQHSRFRLRLSCRRETYNDESRIKVTVHSAAPVQGGKERVEFLKEEVQRLESDLGSAF